MASSSVTVGTTGATGPRMCRAIVDLGGDMLRDILYHHIKPAVIVSYVLASRYYRNHPLNAHQIGILSNANVKGDFSECDITLVYSLLRNLAPTTAVLRPTAGWGKPVGPGDTAIGDDVERLREIRNKMYGHLASTFLPSISYNQYMSELQTICTRMDTIHAGYLASPTPRLQTYSQMLNDIQVTCMDPDMESRYTEELRKMKEKDLETRDIISAVKKDIPGNRPL